MDSRRVGARTSGAQSRYARRRIGATGIDRRRFLQGLGGGALALAGLRAAWAETAPPPNVLILFVDQHRADVMGCAGDAQAHTPNIDRFAAEGVRFSRAVSSAPLCAPFRATLQTGLYAHRHGVENNRERLAPAFKTIAEYFAEVGYDTGYIGKWHLDGGRPKVTPGGFIPPGPRRQGWQEWIAYQKGHEYFDVWRYDDQGNRHRVPGYHWEPTWQTDTMLDFAARKKTAGKPWLYFISYGPPHVPGECPKEFLDLFPPGSIELPPNAASGLTAGERAGLEAVWRLYYAQVASIDHEVGRVLAGLADLGIDRDTVIVYLSDHGDRLGAHMEGGKRSDEMRKAKKGTDGDEGGEGRYRGKAEPFATAFRIPFLLRWPGRIPAGRVHDTLVSSVDMAPTLLGLSGLSPGGAMQGRDLSSWALRGSGPEAEALYLAMGPPRDWRAVWDGRWLYSPAPYDLLFDHETDPYELENLYADPSHREQRTRMAAMLARVAAAAGDPIGDDG